MVVVVEEGKLDEPLTRAGRRDEMQAQARRAERVHVTCIKVEPRHRFRVYLSLVGPLET